MRQRFLSVRLSEQERKELNKIAKRWGCPRSDVLCWLLRDSLLRDGQLSEASSSIVNLGVPQTSNSQEGSEIEG
jgi:hypothetical protein